MIKIASIALLVLLGTVSCGPISISDNNVGDIVTIGVNLNANIETDINTTIVNALVALLTQIGVDKPAQPDVPEPHPEAPEHHPHPHPAPELKPKPLALEMLDALNGGLVQDLKEDESNDQRYIGAEIDGFEAAI
ncbi:hypothetical protein RP20_CCG013494 [Aedes albopictus]|nr:hypothetical protein RP20_CCG013494 [Aedes albopictus]